MLLPLDGALLDRKVGALLLQESQTAGLVVGGRAGRFRAWVATEACARPAAPAESEPGRAAANGWVAHQPLP